MINFIVFFFAFILLFLGIDLLQKNVFTSTVWSRKATHILAGILCLLMPNYLTKWQIVLISALFVLVLYISRVKRILSLHNISRITWGEVYYPLGILVVAIVSIPDNANAYYAGVLCLALSDAVAALVGNVLPIVTFSFGENQKSLGGSIGFFLTTIIIIGFIYLPLGVNVWVIVFISIVISLAEFFTFYGIDNLVVPVLTSLLLIWLI